jgi:hypothetical protein
MVAELNLREVAARLLEHTIGRNAALTGDQCTPSPSATVSTASTSVPSYVHFSRDLKVRLMRAHPMAYFKAEEIGGPSRSASVLGPGVSRS